MLNTGIAVETRAHMWGDVKAELCGLDPQRRVVADQRQWPCNTHSNAQRKDLVVGRGASKSNSCELVEHNRVGLGHDNAKRARACERHIGAKVASICDTQFLNGAQRFASCLTDVIRTRLQPVEFFNNNKRYDDRGPFIA